MQQITQLLQDWIEGDDRAGDEVFELIYPQLSRIASARLRVESYPQRIQTTELVHEAYVKLVAQDRVRWKSRAHFFAVAAQHIRRILVDHARRRHRQKRGNGAIHVEAIVGRLWNRIRSLRFVRSCCTNGTFGFPSNGHIVRCE
ncbi:MAG: ECF-type sigma factor [Thermoanaerobaculia bacterium]|nr:ECF-type sigma factor [Thermoanaerobaculia bacterium]